MGEWWEKDGSKGRGEVTKVVEIGVLAIEWKGRLGIKEKLSEIKRKNPILQDFGDAPVDHKYTEGR